MLIRVQFKDVESNNIVQTWSLFVVPDYYVTLLDTFHGICSEKYSCGRKLDSLSIYDMDKVVASVAISKKVPTNSSDLMPSPLTLKQNDSSLEIDIFSDPVPHEVDGVLHYQVPYSHNYCPVN